MELWQYVLAGVAVALGAFLQGSLGFGLGLLAAPILALVAQPLVPVPLLITAILTTALLIARERRSLDPRGMGWALLGRLPGSALGAAAVAWLPTRGLDATFGVLILLAVATSSIGWAPRPTRGTLVTAGTLSGVMGTAVSTGAAPLALVYQRSRGPELRSTLSGFFFVGSCISLLMLAVFGQVGTTELSQAAALVPAILLGVLVSGLATRHVDSANIRAAVLTVAGLASVGLVIRAILG